MPILNWRPLLIMLSLAGLNGCVEATPRLTPSMQATGMMSQSTPLPRTTSVTPLSGPLITPTVEIGRFPSILNCSDVVLNDRPSEEWNGIKVGTTNRTELEAFVEPAVGIFDDTYYLWRYWAPLGVDDWNYIEACYTNDNVLSALNIYGAGDFPTYLDEWVDIYGKPDRVTWSNDNSIRSLIWYDKGILATYFYFREYTRQVILFAPVTASTWEDSWVYRQLPKGNASPGDAFRLGREDPWGIQNP